MRNDLGAVWQRVLEARLKRRRLLQYAALGAGTLGLGALGCGKEAETPRAAVAPEAAKTPKFGGTLRISYTGDPPDYDPQMSQANPIQNIYAIVGQRLVTLEKGPSISPSGVKVIPDLAEKWEQPNDTTYIFQLRKGVKWHDVSPVNGREVVANDVVYTYQRYIKGKYVMSWLFSDVDRIEAKDNYTVTFTLKEPSASFLTNLAWQYSWIIAPEIVEKEGNLKKHPPVGMGPFTFVSHDRNLKLVYKRNPNWFRKPQPYVDEVHYLIIPDATSEQAAFLAGEVDNYGHLNLGVTDLSDAKNMRKNFPAAQYEAFYAPAWRAPIINARRPPLSDKRVRRAIMMSMDQKGVIDTMYPGEGKFSGIISAAMEDYALPEDEVKQLYKQDVAGAKRLLAEAGFPNGFPLVVTSTNGYGQVVVDLCELFVASLKAAGIDAQIKMLDYASYQKVKSDRSFEILFGSHTAYLEPGQMLEGHYASSGGRNESGINDPKLDDMIKQQKRTLNAAERKKMLQDIERYAAQEVNAVLPTPLPRSYAFWSPRLRNHRPHQDYGWRVGDLWLDT